MNKETIIPIGIIKRYTEFCVVHLQERYKKGLSKLDLFSHMIVFINKDSEVSYVIGKVVKAHLDKGIVITNTLNVSDNTIVYDIKPYFPCEDKIISAEYRQESNVVVNESDIANIEVLASFNTLHNALKLQSIGTYKYDNGQQLKLYDKHFLNQLKNVEYVRILWWFDKWDKTEMRRTIEVNPPYENAPKMGVFATRSPVRPNLIASTLVKINEIDINNQTIHIQGFDGFDGTKIFKLIPYIGKQENIKDWFVPAYLEHWPESKTFNNERTVNETIKLETADVDVLLQRIHEKSNNQIIKHKEFKKQGKKGYISIIGANENNLKNVTAHIPKNKLTIVTGVSGSGKSSLVFDTLYKESQHQYIDIMGGEGAAIEKPQVHEVIGLMPAVAISQKNIGNNSRSTVGTVTGIDAQMRLLYTLIGTRHCPQCYRPIKALPQGQLTEILKQLSQTKKVKLYPFEQPSLITDFQDDEEVIHQYLKMGDGAIEVILDNEPPILLQTKEYCYHCKRIFFSMTSSMFSPNNPEYMCPNCKGTGYILEPSKEKIVANPNISLLDGASKLWGNLRKFKKKPNANWINGQVIALANDMQVDLELPYKELPDAYKKILMHGSGEREVSLNYSKGGRAGVITRPVEGAINMVKRLVENSTSSNLGIAKNLLTKQVCTQCNGEKLTTESRIVTVDSLRYPKALEMTIEELQYWLKKIKESLPLHKLEMVQNILEQLLIKLMRLDDLGLSYLTLNRTVPTLSGGEGQRVKLSAQFNGQLSNILYVLDEPTMGLHPKDYNMLMLKIKDLCKQDNTVVVVEHKKDVMQLADYIIDIGKGAGKYGGNIIASGSYTEICQNEESITGKHLRKDDGDIKNKLAVNLENAIRLTGARSNNLKNIDVIIPKNHFTCVTGVSGSGKSTLISDTVASAVLKYLGKEPEVVGEYKNLEGIEDVNDVTVITQTPIGKTPRSTPATYIGVFDYIREAFAKTEQAKQQKLGKEHFSFNSKSGNCPVCNGAGKVHYKLGIMEDLWIACSACKGTRYKKEVLRIKYKEFNISDVLNMEVREAINVFQGQVKIVELLNTLMDVGLGYIKLGQSATSLSGGEAQRIKLAKGLSGAKKSSTLYILDEPTTGLHFEDIEKLVGIIEKLRESNTVIAIEHNLELISKADYIIDMGPEGGKNGGGIIASGTVHDIVKNEKSVTGRVLQQYFQ